MGSIHTCVYHVYTMCAPLSHTIVRQRSWDTQCVYLCVRVYTKCLYPNCVSQLHRRAVVPDSTSDADFMSTGSGWRYEHALWNITTGQCNFVSCPEMYPLPGRPQAQPLASTRVVYEALCGCDQYWLGSYDDDAHAFCAFWVHWFCWTKELPVYVV